VQPFQGCGLDGGFTRRRSLARPTPGFGVGRFQRPSMLGLAALAVGAEESGALGLDDAVYLVAAGGAGFARAVVDSVVVLVAAGLV